MNARFAILFGVTRLLEICRICYGVFATYPPMRPSNPGPLKSLCGSSSSRVIPRSPAFLVADDEESCTALKILRARFLSVG
jgi:hypothetical protein